jgi:hypothetical protein
MPIRNVPDYNTLCNRCFSALVLQEVIAGSEGETTITVTGSGSWKETITVKKKEENETEHENMEKYLFEVLVRLRK